VKVSTDLSPRFADFPDHRTHMLKPYPSSGAKRVKASETSGPIKILVSAEHALIREGIRALVERIAEVEVVAEAAGHRQSLQLISELQPAIVLLDISIPTVGALESLKEIVASCPGVRVIVLTLQENEEYAVQAFRAGATGYIPKSAASTELELAIRAVARGENYLASELSKQAVLKYLKDPRAFLSELTARQAEVLKMIAKGQATKEIAQRLKISVKTVETHRAQIMERLNIHDIAGLVRYALRMGLVRLDE
jgi:DNA-binding NarL/FixJ family response regulator